MTTSNSYLTFKNLPEVNLSGTDGDDSLTGTSQKDILKGLAGNDTVKGLKGDDTLQGNDGDDYLFGGDGYDSLRGGKGNDSLNGGIGFDTIVAGIGDTIDGGDDGDYLIVNLAKVKANLFVNYTDLNQGIISNSKNQEIIFKNIEGINLKTGSGNDELYLTLLPASQIETGDGNDLIITSNVSDFIYAGNGNDTLVGNAGNDWLNAGAGINQVFGGDGYDFMEMDLSAATENLTIDYQDGNNGTISNGGIFQHIESIQSLNTGSGNDIINVMAASFASVKAGAGDDLIIGVAGNPNNFYNSFLYGEAGNDTLIGGKGGDILYGGEGNDSLVGNEGKDSFYTNGGIDTILGGEGKDFLGFDLATETQDLLINYSNLSQGTVSNGTIFSDIERMHLNTGSGNDILDISAAYSNQRGIKQGSIVNSGDGNDSIITGISNDSIDGGLGNDTITGGDGYDNIFGADGDDLLNGGVGNDFLNGGLGNDLLNGDDGNDSFFGVEGNNTLHGGLGNDNFYSSLGIDQVFGGDGKDYLSISLSQVTQDITVTYSDINSGMVSNGTSFSEIETYNIGTGSGNDTIIMTFGNGTLRGDAGDDTITGGEQNDYLFGGEGNDWLMGGKDHDTIYGDQGNDLIEGGEGYDKIYGGEGNDTIITGDGIHGGTLVGNAGNDFLMGNEDRIDYFGFLSPTDGIDAIDHFTSDFDQILIDDLDFNLPLGEIPASDFVLGTQALDSSDRFIYNQNTGALFYDSDGNGAASQIQLADIANQSTLTNTDILVTFFI